MKQLKPLQRGFVGGAYVAMLVVSVAALGTLISSSANIANKIATSQTVINNQNVMDKLAQYLIQNTARDVDADGLLEMPEQWYQPAIKNAPVESPAYDPQTPGFLPNDMGIPDILKIDAFNKPFQICSVDLGIAPVPLNQNNRLPDEIVSSNPAEANNVTNNLNRVVFAIISGGENGATDTRDCNAIVFERSLNVDDRVRLITYGELVDGQSSQRIGLMRREPPVCAATESLDLRRDGNGNPEWFCRANYMAFATRPLPTCNVLQRLVLNPDGTLSCQNLNTIGNQVPENIPLDKTDAGMCRYGYYMAGVQYYDTIGLFEGSSPSNPYLWYTCARMDGYNDLIAWSSYEVFSKVSTQSCQGLNSVWQGMFTNAQKEQLAAQNKFQAMYRSRDGVIRCMTMPSNLLTEPVSGTPGQQPGCMWTTARYPQTAFRQWVFPYTAFFFDRGKILCGHRNGGSSMSAQSVCLPNEQLEWQTVTNTYSCRPVADPKNWVIPYSPAHPTCSTGDIVLSDGNTNYCMDRLSILSSITWGSSCLPTQMLSWDEVAMRFKCIYR